ncbi:MAG TPA: class GN sortase [Gammaproteobacteria bacterium]
MRHLVLLGILFLGLAEFSYGMWIPAKAWLSQILLVRAWQDSQLSHTDIKPWPWADTWPVLKMTDSVSNQSLLVLQGDSGQALAFGPGLNSQSYQPGQPGNTIISAHRDTHFNFLGQLKIGQQLRLEDRNRHHHIYTIKSVDIVDSRKTRIGIATEQDMLTLVTCYPVNGITPAGSRRYVVTGIREGNPAI